jgi:anti-sigma factor RsiW
MSQSHLTDDELIALCFDSTEPAAHRHLTACTACATRHGSLVQMLAEISGAADAEVDVAFPEDRLARQQARILHRVDQDGRPGRVIAFPAASAQAAPSLRTRSTSRWIAAAAAAAFVIGLAAGHMVHDFPRLSAPHHVALTTPTVTGTTLRVSTTPAVSDDEFLGEIEDAVDSNGPAALRPIDALTPRAWEVR